MKQELNVYRFSKAIRQKRIITQNIGLREAAKEIGVGFATLSRCENGNIPDLNNYATICKWLGVPMETFISKKKNVNV